MEAQKVTMTIKLEALSVNSLSNILTHVATSIQTEAFNGNLTFEDGDAAIWNTEFKTVTF